MNFSDMLDAFRYSAEKAFKPDFSMCQYVTPCCSDVFNEHGTPVGYYIDQYGRKWHQDGSGMVSEERKAPHVHVATSYWSPDTGDVIDVTYEEVKE